MSRTRITVALDAMTQQELVQAVAELRGPDYRVRTDSGGVVVDEDTAYRLLQARRTGGPLDPTTEDTAADDQPNDAARRRPAAKKTTAARTRTAGK